MAPRQSNFMYGPDIIECMASSDNIIRAALTQKFTDINVFLPMLSYKYGPLAALTHRPACSISVFLPSGAISSRSSCVVYDPPAKEITVIATRLQEEGAHARLDRRFHSGILICVEGRGILRSASEVVRLEFGHVFLVSPGPVADGHIRLESADSEPFVTFLACQG
jgi:mannose-6-phosphate isomerase